MGMYETETVSHHCRMVFSGFESPWTLGNKSVFERIKDKCSIISKQREGNASLFLQIISFLKEGLSGKEGK